MIPRRYSMIFLALRFKQDPYFSAGPVLRLQNTHLVIDQLDLLEHRINLFQRLAQCVVEGVNRPVAVGRRMNLFIAHDHLDGRFTM